MADESITATNANRHFSSVLRKVDEGKIIEVTNHGRIVAYVIPPVAYQADRNAARDRLLALFESRPGRPIVPWTRDELYDEE